MNTIRFGTDSECVKITLLRSYSTEGWAQAEVEIAVHCFHGKINPWVEVADFGRFTKELRALYESLQGEAELSPLQKQFYLKFVAESGGHILVSGAAWSQAAHENKLEFMFEIDQSFLLVPLKELEAISTKEAKNGA